MSDQPLEYVELNEPTAAGQPFRSVAEIRDPDGVVAVITERADDGRISFGIFREFTNRGKTVRSAYLAHRHIPACHRLLVELGRRLELLEDRSRMRRRMAG